MYNVTKVKQIGTYCMKSFIINENDANQRTDKFLHKFFKSKMSSSMIYKSIRKKRIKINGKPAKQDTLLMTGDKIDMYINDSFFEADKTPLNIIKHNLDVIYEDQNIVLINKEQGIVVHDDDNGSVNTLIAQLKSYLVEKGEYIPENENSFVPSLCNRIDRNTTGIVIGAKNANALREMNEIIKNRSVTKIYLAVAQGVFNKKSDTLKGYLFKDCKTNKVYVTQTPQKGSSKIITKYKVIKQKSENALIEVELVTGKTHQIRAHFAHINHPLLGDGKYGKIDKNHKYQMLHSYKLIFGEIVTPTLKYLSGKTFVALPKDNFYEEEQ